MDIYVSCRFLGNGLMAANSKDKLRGTLDALVLKTLTWGPRHGYAISRWIQETSRDGLIIEEGSLYPALYRMERLGWVEAEWGMTELGRKARFYTLTRKGRRQLRVETEELQSFIAAVSPILLATR